METLTHPLKLASTLALAAALTGCHIEVVEHYPPSNSHDPAPFPAELTDFDPEYLALSALVGIDLIMVTPNMVANPNAYTEPRARHMARGELIREEYQYLFDSWDCDYGGTTRVEAEADLYEYDSGYRFVDLQLNSRATSCRVPVSGGYQTMTSTLDYQVEGWYDLWEQEVTETEATLTGNARLSGTPIDVRYDSMNFEIVGLGSDDFSILGEAQITLDDFDVLETDFHVTSAVHRYGSERYPHAGSVRWTDHSEWVELTFESDGFWYDDHKGLSYWISWTALR